MGVDDGLGYVLIAWGADPVNSDEFGIRVYRGGSRGSVAGLVRAARRNRGVPTFRSDFLGFRLGKSLP